jgi:hypothetical protein
MWLHVSTNYRVILRPLKHIKSKLEIESLILCVSVAQDDLVVG